MATVDAIQALIAARKNDIARAKLEFEGAEQEVADAQERQRLRRQLDALDLTLASTRSRTQTQRTWRNLLDQDVVGEHQPSDSARDARSAVKPPTRERAGDTSRSVFDCDEAVLDGNIEWTLKGFSWLEETLSQNEEFCAMSNPISVGGHRFTLYYSPTCDEMGECGQRASLAIHHYEERNCAGVVFRYSMWIKSKERGYVQWGDSVRVNEEGDSDDMLFGPDVCDASEAPQGIFGLTHAELSESEWVINDTLTAKVHIKVRPNVMYRQAQPPVVPAPSSNHGDKLLLLLESGTNSDVTFIIQGEEIRAHSVILSTFSDVFQAQFASGMQDSVSKRITIEDCDFGVFKAFLRYLYSESFVVLEGVLVSRNTGNDSGEGGNSPEAGQPDRLTSLRQLLALSHKYQENRLQWWTERELGKQVSTTDVCHLLCQAHLYEAKQLEQKCLDYIAAHKNEVAKSSSFGVLAQEWPQVSLKITLHLARFSKEASARAMDSYESARKRKRTD